MSEYDEFIRIQFCDRSKKHHHHFPAIGPRICHYFEHVPKRKQHNPLWYAKEYKRRPIWCRNALERDNFTCTKCSSTKNLVVHHLDESRKNGYKSMNNSIDNLITLCKPCHAIIHNFKDYRPEIIEFRKKGYTFQAIANKLSISRQRVNFIYRNYR